MNECIRLRGFWDSQMELLGRELKVHVWSSDEGTWSLEIIVVYLVTGSVGMNEYFYRIQAKEENRA